MGFYRENAYYSRHQLFVRPKLLIYHGVPESSIYNGISKHQWDYKLWDVKDISINQKFTWIYYSTVPGYLFEKYKLPSYESLIEILEQERLEDRRKKFENSVKSIKTVLSVRVANCEEFRPTYSKYLFHDEAIMKHCKTHAIIDACISLKNSKYLIKEIYEALKGYNDLVFKISSCTSLGNKLRFVKESSTIEEAILHGLRDKISNAKRVQDDVDKLIMRYLNSPKKLNGIQILDLVNEYLIRQNRKQISQSYIYKLIGDDRIKNEAMTNRYGIKYAEGHLFPHAYFSSPDKPGQLWALDGTRCQFIYKTEKKNWNFLYMFVVMDVMSKKVVGYSFAQSENTKAVLNAFEMACERTMYLPKHIIHDNSSALNSKEMTIFKVKTNLMGVNWRAIKVGNSRDNGVVERFFGVFQESYCKPIDGYLGDGVTSNNINGKPSPEELMKATNSKISRTKDELIDLLSSLISKYNTRVYNRNKRRFGEDYNSDYAKKLNRIHIIQFFWDYKEITVQKSTIIFQIENEQYIYIVYDENFMVSYRNKKVLVRYNRKSLDEIYLFNMKEKYIRKVKRFNPIPKIPEYRSVEDNRRLAIHNKRINLLKEKMKSRYEDIISETDMYINNLPLEISAFTHSLKREKEMAEDEYFEKMISQGKNKENKEKKDSYKDNILAKINDIYTDKGNLKIV